MGVQPLMAGKNVYFSLYCSCMNISKHRICYFKYTKLILVAKGKKPTPDWSQSVLLMWVLLLHQQHPPPTTTTTSSCPEGGRNCNNNIWGRAMMKVSQSGCCFRKLISISTATQFDKTVIRVKHHFSEPYFLIHLEEIITTHSSTHLLLYLSGYGRYFQEVSWPERVTVCGDEDAVRRGKSVKAFQNKYNHFKKSSKRPGWSRMKVVVGW